MASTKQKDNEYQIFMALEDMRKIRIDEERLFDEKVKLAKDDLDKQSNFRFKFICTFFGILAGVVVLCLNYFVKGTVNEQFEEFTKRNIDAKVQHLNFQLSLLSLRIKAVSGDSVSYEQLKRSALTDELAQGLLMEVNMFFTSKIHFRGDTWHSCEIERCWGFKKTNLSIIERVERIKIDPAVSAETLNMLKEMFAYNGYTAIDQGGEQSSS